MIDLGRRRNHDPKNREHQQYPRRRATTEPHTRHTMNARNCDQFYIGGCVGGTGNNALNSAKAYRSRVKYNQKMWTPHRRYNGYLTNEDLITNYSGATRYDPFPGMYPPEDTGSSALGLMKYWTTLGIIGGYDWVIDGGMGAVIAAAHMQPLMIGTVWLDDMTTTGPDGVVHSAVTGEVDVESGHEYLLNEVIPAGTRAYGQLFRTRHLGYENSWGENPPDFGIGGRFFMEDTLAEHLIFDNWGDVCVPKFL